MESLSSGSHERGSGASGGGASVSGSGSGSGSGGGGGQERVVRAFAELARNLQRMRPCVRPAMCKPYGKQSEQLQKSMFILDIYKDYLSYCRVEVQAHITLGI